MASMKNWHFGFLIALLVFLTDAGGHANDLSVAAHPKKTVWEARDSLHALADSNDAAQKCLDGLVWKAAAFDVTVTSAQNQDWEFLVQFPSPVNTGNDVNDAVTMEWYYAKTDGRRLEVAPAIVVVHESGSRMEVGKVFARSLSNLGFHAFMIQLPYYGLRRGQGKKASQQVNQIRAMKQAVADVRRARDAVSILPGIDKSLIALQGTSLGGFVATTAASLDGCYDAVFLMLAGGDLFDIIQNGEKDAAKARERLAKNGFVGKSLRALTNQVEPTIVAHRLQPERVWLYSGLYDKVVNYRNAQLLASVIGLDQSHHIGMPTNHYTGIVFLPIVLKHIQQEMQSLREK